MRSSLIQSSAEVRFSKKKWIRGHLRGVLKHWLVFVTTSVGVFVSLGALVATTRGLFPGKIDYLIVGPWVLVLSVLAGVWKIVATYRTDVPECLKNEGTEAQRICFWQTPGWQFQLSAALIQKHVMPLVSELDRILEKSAFVRVRLLNREGYLDWCRARTQDILRLVDAVNITLVKRVASVLLREDGEPDVREIVSWAGEVKDLFAACVQMEREAREVVPPQSLASCIVWHPHGPNQPGTP